MNTKSISLTIIGLFVFAGLTLSQETTTAGINFSFLPIALVDIEPDTDNSIMFSVVPSGESGESPSIEKTSNESLWINYSSALQANQNSRSIIAQISEGSPPEGVSVYVEASPYSGDGAGNLGNSQGKIELTENPEVIINSIGNCYTNDGINRGHSLNFSLEITDFTSLHSTNNYTFTILYTLSDN